MMRVGFILPSSEYLFDPFRGDPHTHFQILTVLDWHFGDKIKTSLIDLRGIKKEFAPYHIDECDIYLHSIYTLDYNEQVALVDKLCERYPKAIHIAGGPHATLFQEECSKVFDALILGDGEFSVIQAVEDSMNSKLQKIYEQKIPVDINVFPHPRRHYLPKATVSRKGLMTLKNKKGYDRLMSATVMFSRGCAYGCAFCAMPSMRKYAPGMRFRTPQHVEEEILYLKQDYGLEGISILDEIAFPLEPEEAIPYLEAIARTKIVWRGQCRVDSLTPEIAQSLAKSGCVTICLGIESAWQPSLDLINKRITLERAKESIKLLKDNGIECRVYMILGLPAEPEDIVKLTWDFIQETSPTMVYLSLLTVRPGTDLFINPQKYGIKNITTDWDKTMHLYSRYEDETPELTYEYREDAPWGKSLSKETIVKNYLELQKRLGECGLNKL